MKPLQYLLILSLFQTARADPSLTPLLDADDGSGQKYAERFRILTDLDGDGVDDMLLSLGKQAAGAMGSTFTVYLSREGEFSRIGEIWAHPGALTIEPDQGRFDKDRKTRRFSRIWVYLKSSGTAGSFGYYRVGEDSVDKMEDVEIYPGDGGTDLGRAIYEAAFKKSVIPFTVEKSVTDSGGKVVWIQTDT